MSGGSFGYLYSKEDITYSDVAAMATELDARGFKAAAARTWQAAGMLRAAKQIQEEMRDVWHDVEWMCSGDYGEDGANESIAEWSKRSGVPSVAAEVVAEVAALERDVARLRLRVLNTIAMLSAEWSGAK